MAGNSSNDRSTQVPSQKTPATLVPIARRTAHNTRKMHNCNVRERNQRELKLKEVGL